MRERIDSGGVEMRRMRGGGVRVGLGRQRKLWRPGKQAENKQIEGERREKQAERGREARRAGGKLSMSRGEESVTD